MAAVQASIGKKVRVHYAEYMLVPWRVGDDGKVIQALDVLAEDKP